MLSKALPSEELATFLMHTLLQVPRDYLLFPPASDGDCEIEQFFMAICIYLFVSHYQVTSDTRIPGLTVI